MDGALLVIASPHSAPSAALLSTFGGSSVFGVGVSFAFVIAANRSGTARRFGLVVSMGISMGISIQDCADSFLNSLSEIRGIRRLARIRDFLPFSFLCNDGFYDTSAP